MAAVLEDALRCLAGGTGKSRALLAAEAAPWIFHDDGAGLFSFVAVSDATSLHFERNAVAACGGLRIHESKLSLRQHRRPGRSPSG